MENFRISEISKIIIDKKKIADEKYEILFDYIYDDGLITIFTRPGMNERSIVLEMIAGMVERNNNVLYLTNQIKKEKIVNEFIKTKFRSDDLENYSDKLQTMSFYVNDCIFDLNNYSSLEDVILQFTSNNDDKNIIFIDRYMQNEIANFKELKILSKKYNCIIIILCDFNLKIDKILKKKTHKNKISSLTFFHLIMDYYKEAYICSDDVLTIFRDYYSRPISNVSRAFIHKNGAYVAFDCVIEYITDEGEIPF